MFFLVFTPIGAIIILRQKNFETLSVIIPSFLVSLSAVHAYSVPLADTRFLLPLYPFLIKEYNSNQINSSYHVKIFKIYYDIYENSNK